ncbi:endoplasmic reticulum-Golgi intermediate compartment protein 3 [Cephus cinctus]|uniref:Endoplasmic reticulum-Golgi intermediate compartment protein 3 n=1 Tax=Cephus cinctus TaxID=211228 RepID=A0AAJ7C3R1_CEPCN|nr:endoplasmic reticulum-Golgi intermediate compartment protein 3 [Cephus cinctus]
MKILEIFRLFDVYPKTLEERVQTFGGGIVSMISALMMIIFFLCEVEDYLKYNLKEELFVDTSRGSKLRINLDIIIPTISCDLLSLDAMDATGEQHLQIEHNIYKRRLDLDGKPIEDPQKTDIVKTKGLMETTNQNNTQDANECGDCYGATSEAMGILCCNTCEDVRKAYNMKKWAFPDPSSIKQCRDDKSVERMKRAFLEGCQIYGYMEVNRVGGSFHIAPGDSFSVNHVHVHDVQPYSSTQFNMTHKIRHLSFGLNIPGKTNPMDGTVVVASEGAMMFQHYIKIVPTTYVRRDGSTLVSNQFSLTRYYRGISQASSDSGMPGVFFSYELSPLMVKYTEVKKSFGHFTTNVCAAIGGVFTVAGLIDAILYRSVRAIQRKDELGKFS